MSKKTIVIGISSGIAAYKIAELIKLYKKKGHDVYAIMTKNAAHIISPSKIEKLTGNTVYINLFDKDFSYKHILKQKKVDHIELAKMADVFVVAPATANTIAGLARGIADDFISTAILATHAPVLVCPSMNNVMWHHPATAHNIKVLESYGYELLTPQVGNLACGTPGIGRLPDMKVIVQKTQEILERSQLLEGKKVLITAGGTYESIDMVRGITNRSSGKMGLALAQAAYRYGADVTLVHARNSKVSHLPIEHKIYTSVTELLLLLKDNIPKTDVVIHAAAVSDFTVNRVGEKLDSAKPHTLTLSPTKKIINTIKKTNPKVMLIGFKAISPSRHPERVKRPKDPPENTWILRSAQNDSKKLFTDANADYVIVNDISRNDIGFESDENEVYIMGKDGTSKHIPQTTKSRVAQRILKYIFKNHRQ